MVSVIYRHSGGFYADFQEKLTNIIHKFNQFNTQLELVGDDNIDLSKKTFDTKVCKYINEIYSSGCYSIINKPTRISTTSATKLDYVYINSLHKIAVAGRGGVEYTRLEAKAKDTKKSEAKAKDSPSEDRHSRDQGQKCLRPRQRSKNTNASVLYKFFSGDLRCRKNLFSRSTKF